MLTPTSSSTIISTADRQQSAKRRPSDTPLHITKIPQVKKLNTRDLSVTPLPKMTGRTVQQQSSRYREKSPHDTSRRRSLSPHSPNLNSRIVNLSSKSVITLVDSINLHEEIMQRLMEVEKRTYASEQCSFSTEQELQKLSGLVEENKQLHETIKQLMHKLEMAHSQIAFLSAPPKKNPNEIVIDDLDMVDETATTTKDSIHAISDEAWHQRKSEIGKSRLQAAVEKEIRL